MHIIYAKTHGYEHTFRDRTREGWPRLDLALIDYRIYAARRWSDASHARPLLAPRIMCDVWHRNAVYRQCCWYRIYACVCWCACVLLWRWFAVPVVWSGPWGSIYIRLAGVPAITSLYFFVVNDVRLWGFPYAGFIGLCHGKHIISKLTRELANIWILESNQLLQFKINTYSSFFHPQMMYIPSICIRSQNINKRIIVQLFLIFKFNNVKLCVIIISELLIFDCLLIDFQKHLIPRTCWSAPQGIFFRVFGLFTIILGHCLLLLHTFNYIQFYYIYFHLDRVIAESCGFYLNYVQHVFFYDRILGALCAMAFLISAIILRPNWDSVCDMDSSEIRGIWKVSAPGFVM